ncbi:MAG: hypothetical protein ACRDQ0_06835 [Pseudonocardia sp.]
MRRTLAASGRPCQVVAGRGIVAGLWWSGSTITGATGYGINVTGDNKDTNTVRCTNVAIGGQGTSNVPCDGGALLAE